MVSRLRAAARLVVYAGWTLLLIPVQMLGLRLGLDLVERLPLRYHRACCRIIGLEVKIRGEMIRERPVLFVANHSSYLDITVLASLVPGSFVAKREVGGWPFFGLLARLQRTVFVDRRLHQTGVQRDEMQRRLEAGDNLILFPEGTSGDGNRVLPFKSALFAVAGPDAGNRPLTVQPVSVAYTRLDGMPLGRTLRPLVAWYGDMGLVPHMWTMLGLGRITVVVTFHAPVRLADFPSRKALAKHCQRVVSAGLTAAISGREAPAVALRAAAAGGS